MVCNNLYPEYFSVRLVFYAQNIVLYIWLQITGIHKFKSLRAVGACPFNLCTVYIIQCYICVIAL
jgi:hypothetical protein